MEKQSCIAGNQNEILILRHKFILIRQSLKGMIESMLYYRKYVKMCVILSKAWNVCEWQGWDYKLRESQERGKYETMKLSWNRSQKALDIFLQNSFDFIFFRDDINKQETFTHIIKRLIQKSCGSVLGGDKTGCKVGRELKLEH